MGSVTDSCWTKVPYASIFAFLVLLAGFGCFTAPFYIGLDDLEIFLRRGDAFNLNKEYEILWLGQLRIILTVTAIVTAVIGIILVCFGALATGATRRNVYSGATCILGGRCSSVFMTLVTFVFNVIWGAATPALVIPVWFFVMMKGICETEYTYQGNQPGPDGNAMFCFNLTRIGIYFPGHSPDQELKDQFWHGPAICSQKVLTEMCTLVTKEIPLMSAALAGSFLMALALIFFLMINISNYMRIKTAKELTDYRDALEQDTTEMDNIITSRRPFNSSYASESVLT